MNIPLWLYTYTYAICTNRCLNVRHRTRLHQAALLQSPSAQERKVCADAEEDVDAEADAEANKEAEADADVVVWVITLTTVCPTQSISCARSTEHVCPSTH